MLCYSNMLNLSMIGPGVPYHRFNFEAVHTSSPKPRIFETSKEERVKQYWGAVVWLNHDRMSSNIQSGEGSWKWSILVFGNETSEVSAWKMFMLCFACHMFLVCPSSQNLYRIMFLDRYRSLRTEKRTERRGSRPLPEAVAFAGDAMFEIIGSLKI